MLEAILMRGARRVVTGGNIGRSIIQELDTITKNDIVLLELSSFQLETLGVSPHIAVITNVSEDHLDHHGTREAYVAAKRPSPRPGRCRRRRRTPLLDRCDRA
jgi:UDP-N-acetylmuramoylalanine--D-glutamate ligase